jgi:hypothetical protein
MRVAKSGRVTCFIPGTMGLTPTASDPHSGMAVNPTNPSGGMIPQPFGSTPNTSSTKAPPKNK